jgi:hypothetical protein
MHSASVEDFRSNQIAWQRQFRVKYETDTVTPLSTWQIAGLSVIEGVTTLCGTSGHLTWRMRWVFP